eukprot:CAMPEP_0197539962 /NCGR_PEP_ID=MMETSP1318-20131121/64326_1 /TAXON_ID=552666 /ORGANISM="Partenskyella glossopodia, Strain RCC365" /LENGTH=101 /DNA_ID=CAMNT_0043098823 /DNA_START=353 /DNA_END=655 /DNA_ORIENTATION=+
MKDQPDVCQGFRCTKGHLTQAKKLEIEKWIDKEFQPVATEFIARMQQDVDDDPQKTRSLAKRILRDTGEKGMLSSHQMLFVLYPLLTVACSEAQDYSQAAW